MCLHRVASLIKINIRVCEFSCLLEWFESPGGRLKLSNNIHVLPVYTEQGFDEDCQMQLASGKNF